MNYSEIIAISLAVLSAALSILGAWDKILSLLDVRRRRSLDRKVLTLDKKIKIVENLSTNTAFVVAHCGLVLSILITCCFFAVIVDLSSTREAKYVGAIEYVHYACSTVIGMAIGDLVDLKNQLLNPQKTIENLKKRKSELS